MNRKIAIIHRSEIVRKGLLTILRSFFNLEISIYSQVKEFPNHKELPGIISCIIIEAEIAVENGFVQKYKMENDINIIGMYAEQIDNGQSGFDEKISCYTSADILRTIISDMLKSSNQLNNVRQSEDLTSREKEVLKLIALGHSNKEMADMLFISIHTIISHRKNITEKLGIKSISGLTVYAILNKLLDTENINPENLI